jgi:hypothetical protein
MPDYLQFNDILEAVDHLPVEDQESLIDILSRRLHDIRRSEIVHDVESAQKEYAKGQCSPVSPDELMKEILR